MKKIEQSRAIQGKWSDKRKKTTGLLTNPVVFRYLGGLQFRLNFLFAVIVVVE